MPANSSPAISVLVRTAGRAPFFLRRALASIREQTFPPAEVVVVNAGGEPGIVDAIVRDARLEKISLIVRHHTALAQAAAANRALDLATAEWITFLDDDDTWAPTFLERIAAVIVARRDVLSFGGVVTQTQARYERFTRDAAEAIGEVPFNPELEHLDLAALAVKNRFTNNALVFRRSALAVIGPFRDELPALYDWEFNVRLATRFHLEVIAEPLARYHQRPPQDNAPNTAQADMRRAHALIRNEWLRADLAAGRIGLGQLALSGESVGLGAALERFQRWQRRVRGWLGRANE